MKIASRSQTSRFLTAGLIAAAGTYLEHKSCAVKPHAYTLDNSNNLASALQQDTGFPQLPGTALFFRVGMIRAVRQRTNPLLINP
jgi:hypothetical protein